MLIVFKYILIKKMIHKSNHHPQTLIIFESGTAKEQQSIVQMIYLRKTTNNIKICINLKQLN
ncbi:hypothetical protein pb186bvf_017952 [Paramecium bursaria]